MTSQRTGAKQKITEKKEVTAAEAPKAAPLPAPVHSLRFDAPSIAVAPEAGAAAGGDIDRLVVVPGKWRNALRFGAEGAKVVAIGAPDLPPPWTVSTWIRREQNVDGATLLGSERSAIKIDQWETGSQLGLTRYGVADWSIEAGLPLGEWAYLAVVGTETDTTFYVNGARVGVIAESIDLPRTYLGSSGGWTEFMEASLEDLVIFDKALTAEQVAELFGAAPIAEIPRGQWNDLGDSARFVTALSLPDGRFVVFGIGADGDVWTRRQSALGGALGAAKVLAERGARLCAGIDKYGCVSLAYCDAANAYWIRTEKAADGDWGDAVRIGSDAHDPSVASHRDGRLVVFVRSGSKLRATTQKTPGGAWVKEEALGGSIASGVTAAQSENGCIHAFARAADGGITYKAQPKTNGPLDGPWTSLGGVTSGVPTVAISKGNTLCLFARGGGEDGSLWMRRQKKPNGKWADWISLGGSVVDPAVVATSDGELTVYARSENNELIAARSSDSFSTFTSLGGDIRGALIPIQCATGVAVFAVGGNGTLWMHW